MISAFGRVGCGGPQLLWAAIPCPSVWAFTALNSRGHPCGRSESADCGILFVLSETKDTVEVALHRFAQLGRQAIKRCQNDL